MSEADFAMISAMAGLVCSGLLWLTIILNL